MNPYNILLKVTYAMIIVLFILVVFCIAQKMAFSDTDFACSFIRNLPISV